MSQQEGWVKSKFDPILRRLLETNQVAADGEGLKREYLIQLAQKHFPTTIGTDRDSINNRVKYLRKKIIAYRLGLASNGARAPRNGMFLSSLFPFLFVICPPVADVRSSLSL